MAEQAVTRLSDIITKLAAEDRPTAAPQRAAKRAAARGEQIVDGPELLAALAALRQLRDQLSEWEPTLIGAARAQGATWGEIAPALGLTSRQAAERRYLRLNSKAGEAPATTREQRVQAARDQRSADRAVAGWARQNAAVLRQLAGEITALKGLGPTARASVDRVHQALGANDAADLLDPLSEAGPRLSRTHPAVADRIQALGQTTEDIRAADHARRTGPADR
ncbi:hypothetical protein [Kribbella sp.]|uniref:hypothetical protein n=1 Tax=Kribbella sp. TaxID=1871183 RepID=UPI002D47DDF4|nr:hypothetical protein [Kribbella sp.]HZX02827.1 hypothetical protein [Kribbella sp.]